MRYIILTLTLLFGLSSFSQSQTINGITFDAPIGYVKSDNLTWTKNNNVLRIVALDRVPSSSLQAIVEQDTRYTKHFRTYDFKYNGKTHKLGVHNSNNGLVQGQLAVNKKDHCYIIMIALEPKSLTAENSVKVESVLEELFYMIGFTVPRINP